MEHIIKAAVERGASDLHIKAGDVFRARINGVLKPLTKQRLTPEQTKAIAMELVPTDYVRDQLDTILDYDCSWGAPGIGRFRVNILRQRSSFMVVMRVIPFDVPSLEKLRLPPVVQGVAELDHGLVLVTGPTGSGKSSTVAALIHHINSQMNKHVITVESPIEFLHRDLKGSVTQREVGVDTDNLASGLQSSLRQDPDVVVVQELLDHEMVDAALTAAETGRLVISTLHTPDATTTVSRLVALFGHDEREVARIRIADAMGGVISQRLLSTSDGQRCVAAEVAIASPAMRSVVRDRHRAGDMYQLIADSRETSGMQTLDQHLVDLVNHGVVEYDLAIAACTNEEEFRRLDAMVRERLAGDSESTERRGGRRTRRHGPRDRRRRRDTSQGNDT